MDTAKEGEDEEERFLRHKRYEHVEFCYAAHCLGFSREYLTTSDWYCGSNLRWLYTFEPELYRKYSKERLPVGWTALDALWRVGLAKWWREARAMFPPPLPSEPKKSRPVRSGGRSKYAER